MQHWDYLEQLVDQPRQSQMTEKPLGRVAVEGLNSGLPEESEAVNRPLLKADAVVRDRTSGEADTREEESPKLASEEDID